MTDFSTSNSARPQVGPSTLATAESSWWERERLVLLRETMADPVARHIDVGCGRGSVAVELAAAGSYVVAVDMHRYDEWIPSRNVAYVVARVDQLPFRDGAFQRSSALDVIEHAPDDLAVLREMRRVCDGESTVVITVPADPRLWSAHDEAVGHHRRYTTRALVECAAAAGFRPRRTSHFFAWLFAPAWLMRNRAGGEARSEGGAIGGAVAAVFGRAERAWLRRRRLPIGTSLLLVGDVDPALRGRSHD